MYLIKVIALAASMYQSGDYPYHLESQRDVIPAAAYYVQKADCEMHDLDSYDPENVPSCEAVRKLECEWGVIEETFCTNLFHKNDIIDN